MSELAEKISVNIADAIQKKYGKNREANIFYGDATKLPTIRRIISTQAANLDIITARTTKGRYGLPCGRFVYVYGPEKCGKTTLAMHIIMEVQRLGGVVFYIEGESAFDYMYAQTLGVDVDHMIFSQPDTLEEAVEYIIYTTEVIRGIRKKEKGLSIPIVIVTDSISAFPTEYEVKNGTIEVGGHARLVSSMSRVLTRRIAVQDILFFFILQRRRKIGVTKWQNPDTFIGGDALKMHCSVGLRMNRIRFLKEGDDRIGISSRVLVEYNKCLPPSRYAEVDIIWGKGIDKTKALLSALMEKNIIVKKGSWYHWTPPGKKKIKWMGTERFEEILEKSKYRMLINKALRGAPL